MFIWGVEWHQRRRGATPLPPEGGGVIPRQIEHWWHLVLHGKLEYEDK